MTWVDLHLHSCCSDGADAPETVIRRAHHMGIAAAALTDHDTVSGVSKARQEADSLGMEFLTGIEISATFEKQEVHIIGLGLQTDAACLAELLARSNQQRAERVKRIAERLEHLGIVCAEELLVRLEGIAPVGRMHVAVVLNELGLTISVQQAFERYLNRNCRAYVPKELPGAAAAIEAIHGAGGLAFIAHPGLGTTLRKRLSALLSLPFDGIEAWHISHTPQMVHTFKALAAERSLLVTGGSDCHGDIKKEKPTMGRVKTPYGCFERIRERIAAR